MTIEDIFVVPDGYTERSEEGVLNISYSSASSKIAALVGLVLYIPYSIFLMNSKNMNDSIFVWSVYICLAIVLYVTIWGMCYKIQIFCSLSRLKVNYGPIPFPCFLAKDVETSNIKQIFCDDQRTFTSWGIFRRFYVLKVVFESGKSEVLVRDLRSLTDARFIERSLRKKLELNDIPVAGGLR